MHVSIATSLVVLSSYTHTHTHTHAHTSTCTCTYMYVISVYMYRSVPSKRPWALTPRSRKIGGWALTRMTGRLLRVNFAELASRLILGGNDFQRKQLRVYSNLTGLELHCMNAYKRAVRTPASADVPPLLPPPESHSRCCEAHKAHGVSELPRLLLKVTVADSAALASFVLKILENSDIEIVARHLQRHSVVFSSSSSDRTKPGLACRSFDPTRGYAYGRRKTSSQ